MTDIAALVGYLLVLAFPTSTYLRARGRRG